MERKIYISSYNKTAVIGEDLIEFLKKEGVIKKFINNVKNADWSETARKLITINGIGHAFEWIETPEGHEFWENINAKYKN